MDKVMGKTLYRQVSPALSCHISDEPFAFLPRGEATLQLLRFTVCITDKFYERANTAAIFLDTSRAYDTAWTAGLTYKSYTAGIQDSSLLRLASYLTDRKFTVKMEGKFPEWKPIRAGVPQSTVLALLLYHIHIADMPMRPGIEISQFAANIAAFTSNKISITQSTTCRGIYLILNHGYINAK
jgi:hypothetical protein